MKILAEFSLLQLNLTFYIITPNRKTKNLILQQGLNSHKRLVLKYQCILIQYTALIYLGPRLDYKLSSNLINVTRKHRPSETTKNKNKISNFLSLDHKKCLSDLSAGTEESPLLHTPPTPSPSCLSKS